MPHIKDILPEKRPGEGSRSVPSWSRGPVFRAVRFLTRIRRKLLLPILLAITLFLAIAFQHSCHAGEDFFESKVRPVLVKRCYACHAVAKSGVRFVELIDTGSSNDWDAHGDMNSHIGLAKNVDQPIAALLKDLKQRGMLDETLVVWKTEFGRTPFNKSADAKGREHHPWALTSWLAGAGVKSGIVHGSTDEYGLRAIEKLVHVHDFHATILHLMGFDHQRLTFRHAGRDDRLTDVHGNVVREVIA